MRQIVCIVFISLILFELKPILGTEWCELGCEESQLDIYLNECRNACNSEPENEPKNKLQEYLKCMFKSCLQEGKGPNDQILYDHTWIECSERCDREQLLTAHEITEKPVFHTQYLSDKQYENFKIIKQMESLAEKRNKPKKKIIRRKKISEPDQSDQDY